MIKIKYNELRNNPQTKEDYVAGLTQKQIKAGEGKHYQEKISELKSVNKPESEVPAEIDRINASTEKTLQNCFEVLSETELGNRAVDNSTRVKIVKTYPIEKQLNAIMDTLLNPSDTVKVENLNTIKTFIDGKISEGKELKN